MAGLIHVGAWDGREYVDHDGPLLLFEPQAEAFRALRRNVGMKPNVVLVKAALGSAPGFGEMFTANPDHSSSLLRPKRHLDLLPRISFDGREPVRITTLDRITAALPAHYEELVIDTQGYELEVLRGAVRTLEQISEVRCEVNLEELYEGCPMIEDIDDFLADQGFERTETDLYGGSWGDATYRRSSPGSPAVLTARRH